MARKSEMNLREKTVPRPRTPRLRAIHAAVLRRPGLPLTIEELELEAPRDDEVLVRLVASGICHTDVDFCEAWASSPVVLGHEGAGIVEEVGQAVRNVRRGDHVVLSYQSCGRCGACKKGHPTDCRHFWDLNLASRASTAATLLRGAVCGGTSSVNPPLPATRSRLSATW